MKKTGLAGFCFLFIFTTNAQDSVVYKLNQYFTIINNTDFTYWRVIKKINDTTWERSDYTQLWTPYQTIHFKDSSLNIRHGRYTKYFNTRVQYSGKYEEDQPSGTWYFFSKKNTIADSLEYDFYKNTFPHCIFLDTENEKADIKFPGGDKAWKRYLRNSIEAVELFEEYAPVKLQIVIRFIIDSSGKTLHVSPIKSINPEADLEIVNIIRKSPLWKVGKELDPKKIYIMIQPITF